MQTGGRGSKNPKTMRTSYLDASVIKIVSARAPAALVRLRVVAEVVVAVGDVARAAPLRPREDEESAQGRRVLRPTRRNL